MRFRADELSCPVFGSTPHLGHSVAPSGSSAPHLGHIASLLSTILSRSRPARNSVLSLPAGFSTAVLAERRTVVRLPALPAPDEESPAGILTFVSHSGHLTALPRAESGAFSTFSHLGQRTLTAMITFLETRFHSPESAKGPTP